MAIVDDMSTSDIWFLKQSTVEVSVQLNRGLEDATVFPVAVQHNFCIYLSIH